MQSFLRLKDTTDHAGFHGLRIKVRQVVVVSSYMFVTSLGGLHDFVAS